MHVDRAIVISPSCPDCMDGGSQWSRQNIHGTFPCGPCERCHVSLEFVVSSSDLKHSFALATVNSEPRNVA